jgi:hypothetical protein
LINYEVEVKAYLLVFMLWKKDFKGGGVVASYPLLSQAPTPVEVESGVNQRPTLYLYSGPTSMLIISLPGQPYHIIDFSFIFKHEFSEYIYLFIKNHKFGL